MGEKHHNFLKKGSKSELLKTFVPTLGFYTVTKNHKMPGPPQSNQITLKTWVSVTDSSYFNFDNQITPC